MEGKAGVEALTEFVGAPVSEVVVLGSTGHRRQQMVEGSSPSQCDRVWSAERQGGQNEDLEGPAATWGMEGLTKGQGTRPIYKQVKLAGRSSGFSWVMR